MKCTIEKIRNIELAENRVGSSVECFLHTDTNLIPNSILKWIFYYTGVRAVIYDDGIKLSAWAESKCSENDEYDLKLGSHISESKAKAKVYRFIRTFSDKMVDVYHNIANDFEDAWHKYSVCVDHEEEHINYLTNID